MSESAEGLALDPSAHFYRSVLGLLELDGIDALLRAAVRLLADRTRAREAFIQVFTDDGAAGSTRVASAGCSPERVSELEGVVSSGIVAAAMASGEVIETANAQLDPRFYEFESVQRQRIEAVLCVPIVADPLSGAIYLQGRPGRREFRLVGPEERADVERIARVLSVSLERLGASLPRVPSTGDDHDAFADLVCASPSLREAIDKLRFAASLEVPVWLTGARGTGKSLLAYATHRASRRREGPFVEFSCAGLSPQMQEIELFGAEPGAHPSLRAGGRGKIELAEGGTLLIDDLAELAPALQSKLLQWLQSQSYLRVGAQKPSTANVRVMATSPHQLKEAVAAKRFREDLYERLKVLEVRVPALSERPEDIAPLARHFARQAASRHELSVSDLRPNLLRALAVTDWAGNVRELAHQVEMAALNAEQRGAEAIDMQDMFPGGGAAESGQGAPMTLHQAVREVQRQHIARALASTQWNMSEAARLLDVSRAHLYTLVRALHVRN